MIAATMSPTRTNPIRGNSQPPRLACATFGCATRGAAIRTLARSRWPRSPDRREAGTRDGAPVRLALRVEGRRLVLGVCLQNEVADGLLGGGIRCRHADPQGSGQVMDKKRSGLVVVWKFRDGGVGSLA